MGWSVSKFMLFLLIIDHLDFFFLNKQNKVLFIYLFFTII